MHLYDWAHAAKGRPAWVAAAAAVVQQEVPYGTAAASSCIAIGYGVAQG